MWDNCSEPACGRPTPRETDQQLEGEETSEGPFKGFLCSISGTTFAIVGQSLRPSEYWVIFLRIRGEENSIKARPWDIVRSVNDGGWIRPETLQDELGQRPKAAQSQETVTVNPIHAGPPPAG